MRLSIRDSSFTRKFTKYMTLPKMFLTVLGVPLQKKALKTITES